MVWNIPTWPPNWIRLLHITFVCIIGRYSNKRNTMESILISFYQNILTFFIFQIWWKSSPVTFFKLCRARESLKDTVSHSRVLAGAIESSSNRVDLMLKFSKRKIVYQHLNSFVSWPIESSSNHVNRVIMLRTKSCFQRAYWPMHSFSVFVFCDGIYHSKIT